MSVATTYARALFEAVEAKEASPAALAGTCQRLESEMESLLGAVSGSKEAQVALFGPVTNSAEKVSLVKAIASKMGAHPMMTTFLVLLANKGRLRLLKQIRDEFGAVRLNAEGGIQGRVASAEPMNELEVEDLAKAFSRKLGKRVAFRVSTDPALLAGLKVTVSGVTYDGTLRSQLQRLRDKFLAGASRS
ncbi:MAG: ATP synthase F1 subunit delta [Oligoflexia bacterium]|nr:ATP synthase F1 subunit delta [Oligoflexia bacterium]